MLWLSPQLCQENSRKSPREDGLEFSQGRLSGRRLDSPGPSPAGAPSPSPTRITVKPRTFCRPQATFPHDPAATHTSQVHTLKIHVDSQPFLSGLLSLHPLPKPWVVLCHLLLVVYSCFKHQGSFKCSLNLPPPTEMPWRVGACIPGGSTLVSITPHPPLGSLDFAVSELLPTDPASHL